MFYLLALGLQAWVAADRHRLGVGTARWWSAPVARLHCHKTSAVGWGIGELCTQAAGGNELVGAGRVLLPHPHPFPIPHALAELLPKLYRKQQCDIWKANGPEKKALPVSEELMQVVSHLSGV